MARICERIDFQQVAALARANSVAVLGRLLPDGRRVGAEWIARNPRRVDRRPGSFQINLRTGRWCDFATGDKGGDLISLTAYLDAVPQAEAARRLCRVFGIEQ